MNWCHIIFRFMYYPCADASRMDVGNNGVRLGLENLRQVSLARLSSGTVALKNRIGSRIKGDAEWS